jgi:hypothetical protein
VFALKKLQRAISEHYSGHRLLGYTLKQVDLFVTRPQRNSTRFISYFDFC